LRGFTLLELIVVFVVIGLVAAVAAPAMIGRLGPAQVETAARELASRLRQTRSAAIGGNVDLVFTIDVENRSYAVPGRPPRPLPSGIELGMTTAETERLGRGAGAIRFFPDGSSTGGEIRLSSGAAGYRVEVDWLTGRVRLREGDRAP
jgi:general secretion pathway protein H